MSDNKLIVLGSASGLPQAARACSGYLLKVGADLSLIDCGSGVTSSFLRRGFDSLDVGRVFITHTHPDHVSDLPLFIQLTYLNGRTEPLEVYLPNEFVMPFKQYLTSVYLIEEKLPFDLNLIGYKQGVVYDGSFRLTALSNRHLQGYAEFIDGLELPNRMECYSFVIEVGDKSVFYSSDIASYDDVGTELDNRDVVVLESTHIDLDEFFQDAPGLRVGCYVITHLGTDEEVAAINRMAAKAGISTLVTATDGMEIDI